MAVKVCVGLFRFDQGDDAAAEAAAGHAGAEGACGEGGVDGGVELGHGDLEVVAERGVGRGEQRADVAQAGRRATSRPLSTRSISVTTCRTRRR